LKSPIREICLARRLQKFRNRGAGATIFVLHRKSIRYFEAAAYARQVPDGRKIPGRLKREFCPLWVFSNLILA